MNYDEEELLSHIISYCIVRHSDKIETRTQERVNSYERKFPKDFNPDSKTDCQIILAGEEFGVTIGTIQSINKRFSNVSNFVQEYEYKHNKDAYCRIGKKLLFETRDGKFKYKNFAVLCAIQSIIGKTKKHSRITKDRIRYRMRGYKSKVIAEQEMNGSQHLLSDRQLYRIISTLHAKKFFSKFTYAKRETYYSTRLTDEELRDEIREMKIFFARRKLGIEDAKATDEIKTQLRLIKLPREAKSA